MQAHEPAEPGLPRRFFRLAIPNILSNLTVPLAGLVDMAMLGHLAEIRHLAGVALGAVIFDYVYWTFGFLRMGTTGLVAQAVGRGDADGTLLVALRGVAAAVVLGLLLLLGRDLIRDASFAILSGTPPVEDAGRSYFDARIWGAPAALTNLVILGWLLGRERAGQALALAVIGNGANVALDYLLIVRLQLAATGAGWATALSQVLMLVAGIVVVRTELDAPRLRRLLPRLGNRRALVATFVLNGDIMVRTLALVSTFAIFTNLASAMGTVVLAGAAVLKNVVNLAAFFIDGFAFATESLAGIFRGAGRSGDQRRLLKLSIVTSLVTGVLFASTFMIFPRPLLSLLTDHAAALDLMEETVAWLLPVLLFGSIAYALDGYFLGLTEGRILSVAMVAAVAVGFLPWAKLAASRQSVHLLWLALAFFMAARVLSLGVMVPRSLRETRARARRPPA